MSSHRIDGRKLSRKVGPRLSLYANLIVSVLRYEKVKTTEATHYRRIAQIDLEEISLNARRTIVTQDAVELDCDLHPEMDRIPW